MFGKQQILCEFIIYVFPMHCKRKSKEWFTSSILLRNWLLPSLHYSIVALIE